MTNNSNATKSASSFNFASKEDAIALYLDAKSGHDALSTQLAQQESYMSNICKALLETFGSKAEGDDKLSLQLDLGDGAARGHIVVVRTRKDDEGNDIDPLYFIRERNSGRPAGSKNKKPKVAPVVEAAATEAPTVVVEESSEVVAPAPKLSAMDQAVLVAEQDIAEREAAAAAAASVGSDETLAAILSVTNQAISAIQAHASRTTIAPSASPAE